MSTHTPGPWKRVVNSIHSRTAQCIVVRLPAYTDCAGDESQEQIDRWNADARLIAAAPELLEALEMCRSAILGGELVPGYDSIGPSYNQVFGRSFIKHLGKVISKARGDMA